MHSLATEISCSIENAAELWLKQHAGIGEVQDYKPLTPIWRIVLGIAVLVIVGAELRQRTFRMSHLACEEGCEDCYFRGDCPADCRDSEDEPARTLGLQ
jgi:hypothetical protein